jgi:hypothetical protein
VLEVLTQQWMAKNATEKWESYDIPHIRPVLVVPCGDVFAERKDTANGK